jgi:hypothetical protein
MNHIRESIRSFLLWVFVTEAPEVDVPPERMEAMNRGEQVFLSEWEIIVLRSECLRMRSRRNFRVFLFFLALTCVLTGLAILAIWLSSYPRSSVKGEGLPSLENPLRGPIAVFNPYVPSLLLGELLINAEFGGDVALFAGLERPAAANWSPS